MTDQQLASVDIDDLLLLDQLDQRRVEKRGRDDGFEVDTLSGIRVQPTSRRLSRDEVGALATAFAYRKLSALGQPAPAAAWMTIGVLVEKSAGKETVRGDKFCVWKLSDLARGSTPVHFWVVLGPRGLKRTHIVGFGACF